MARKPSAKPHASGDEMTKIGNYDTKAKVVAEKLKGKKDLQVINWARNHLNFNIQYRRNIYRWKNNPIILRLAKQYAGLIEDAEVPDRIKNSYRVLNSKGEDVYDFLAEYVKTAIQFEMPINDAFIKSKFHQLCAEFEMTSEEASNFISSATDRIKRLYKLPATTQRKAQTLKSATKQVFINNRKELDSLIKSNARSSIYCLYETMMQYQLVDDDKLEKYGLDDLLYEDELSYEDNALEDNDGDFRNESPPLLNKALVMICCASLDGLAKCKFSFISQFPKPKKAGFLSSDCNYYCTDTGWINRSFFESYLQVLSLEIGKRRSKQDDSSTSLSNANQPVLLICNESYTHDVPDDAVPDNIKLVVIEKNLYSQIQNLNGLVLFLKKSYQYQILYNFHRTISIMGSLESQKASLLDSLSTSIIIKSLKTPIVESMNIINEIWLNLSPEIGRKFGTLFTIEPPPPISGNNKSKGVKREGETVNFELSEENHISVINTVDIKIAGLLEILNQHNIVKRSSFSKIENILNLDRSDKNLSYALELETLQEADLSEDFIYQKVLRKIGLKPSFEAMSGWSFGTSDNDSIRRLQDWDISASPCPTGVSPSDIPNVESATPIASGVTEGLVHDGNCELRSEQGSLSSTKSNILSINSIVNEHHYDPDKPVLQGVGLSPTEKRPQSLQSMPINTMLNNSNIRNSTFDRQKRAITDSENTRNLESGDKRSKKNDVAVSSLEGEEQYSHKLSSQGEKNTAKGNTFGNQVHRHKSDEKDDFEKAVFNLHLQFVNKPYGPFKDQDIYKEMSFEQIYLLTLENSHEAG